MNHDTETGFHGKPGHETDAAPDNRTEDGFGPSSNEFTEEEIEEILATAVADWDKRGLQTHPSTETPASTGVLQKAGSGPEPVREVRRDAESVSRKPTEPGDRDDSLSAEEQERLQDCERAVHQFYKAGVECGRALRAIRDEKLYRASHKTFQCYAEERFGISRSSAYRLIGYADVLDNLLAVPEMSQTWDISKLPSVYSHLEPLIMLPREQQAEAWQRVLAQADGKTVTGKLVKEVVNEMKGSPGSAGHQQTPVSTDGTAARPENGLPSSSPATGPTSPVPEPRDLQAPSTTGSAGHTEPGDGAKPADTATEDANDYPLQQALAAAREQIDRQERQVQRFKALLARACGHLPLALRDEVQAALDTGDMAAATEDGSAQPLVITRQTDAADAANAPDAGLNRAA